MPKSAKRRAPSKRNVRRPSKSQISGGNNDSARLTANYLDTKPERAAQAEDAVQLLRLALEDLPEMLAEGLFANDVAAQACFAKAYRELRACLSLVRKGYHTTVYASCRSAWEAGMVGRHLAKEPELADEWLKKGRWIPPGDTSKWMKKVGFLDLTDEQRKHYSDNYNNLSALTHPTAQACLSLVVETEEGLALELDSTFDAARLEDTLTIIASTALFVCFAFRNAAANPVNLNPDWLRALAHLAERVSGEPMQHLRLDWDRERQRHAKMRQLVREANELDGFLDDSPLSTRNLLRKLDDE